LKGAGPPLEERQEHLLDGVVRGSVIVARESRGGDGAEVGRVTLVEEAEGAAIARGDGSEEGIIGGAGVNAGGVRRRTSGRGVHGEILRVMRWEMRDGVTGRSATARLRRALREAGARRRRGGHGGVRPSERTHRTNR
jgi:hypothetical protein